MLPEMWEVFDEILYLQKWDTAIISDIHFNSSENSYTTKFRILNTIQNINPNKLIINGDLCYLHQTDFEKYRYCTVLSELLHELVRLVNTCIYLEGNHEQHSTIFPKCIENLNIHTGLYYTIGNTVVTHGHKSVDIESDRYIIGHVHPRKQNDNVYHYKESEYKDGSLTIMPAFAENVDGVDINNYDGICPMLGDDTQEYQHVKVKNL